MTNAALLRPAWTPLTIAVMVIGFIIAWPLGLAMLAYILWGDRFSSVKDTVQNMGESFGAKCENKATKWNQSSRRRPTGNVAFDDWREAELQRLEEERQKLDDMMQEFDDYSRELRRAKDQEEFDDFLNSRHKSDKKDVQSVTETKKTPAKTAKKAPKRPSV
jgi:hypothetical protein